MADYLHKTKPRGSLCGRVLSILRAITVEPVAFLMIMGYLLSVTVSQTLALEKACRVNLQLPEAACDALRNQDSDANPEVERIVQEYMSSLITYKSIITSVLPCLLLVFAGGWMDLTGRRKIMMLLPVFGQILLEISNIMNVVFFHQLKVEVLVFSEAVLFFIFGGYNMLFLAVFSFITDITTEKNRTHRLGFISFGVFIGMPVGSVLSGVFLKTFGYLPVYSLTLTLACINGCYIIFKLSDPPRTVEHKEHDNRGFVYFMKIFFSPAHFLNSLKVVLKKTEENRRAILCLLIATACLIFGASNGEGSIMYLSTRYRFNWDELQYSIYQTFNTVITTIATMFSILVLSKKLGWHDSVLGIMSTTSKIASAFLYCFAPTGTVFFIGPLVDMINGTATIALRAIMSKSVEKHEISKLNSILGIAEVLMPVLFVPIYMAVYTNTMEILAGAVFLLGAAFSIPPLGVFLWLFYRHRKNVTRTEIKDLM